MSRYHFVRTDGVEIRNCLFERGHGSVTVGSEVAGGVENVHITRCIFDGTDRGVRIKTRRGRGDRSYLGGLVFEKIRMNRVHMAMTVNMFYFCDPDGHSDYVQDQEPHPVDDRTPVIGPIVIRDVTVTGADASFVCAYGLPERPIEKIELENISVEFLPEEERTPQVPVMMDNFPKLSGRSIYLRNVKEVILKDLTIAGAADTEPELIGVESIRTENLQYR
jgi:polygalacturonase